MTTPVIKYIFGHHFYSMFTLRSVLSVIRSVNKKIEKEFDVTWCLLKKKELN